LYIVEFESQRVKCLRCRDGEWLEVCLYDFGGSTLPQQRDCYSFFLKTGDLVVLKDLVPTVMVGNTFGSGKPQQRKWNFEARINKQRLHYKHMGKVDMYLTDSVTYNCSSAAGDCGSLLIALVPGLQRKVYGFHLFGGAMAAYSGGGLVTQEILDRVLGQEIVETQVDRPVSFKQGSLYQQTNADTMGLSLDVLGEIKHVPYISRKNGFVETPLRECLGFIKEPSDMRADPDPLWVGTLMYGSDVIEKTMDYREGILDYLVGKYTRADARILTTEESLNKVGGMDALNLHTSAGYPLCVLGLTKFDFITNDGGRLYFSKDADLDYATEEVEKWKKMSSNVFWISTLKDELVKPGKLARVFEIPPLLYTVAT
jgi:hypothetical protein